MNLKDFTDEDLSAELARRKAARLQRPAPLEQPNWQPLHVMVAEYAAWCDSDDYNCDGASDWEHYIYERAVECVYGKAFWDWINRVRG